MYEITLRKTRSYAPVTAEVTLDVYEQIEKLIAPPKSPAQRIREQLEAERMTVKQMLENNASPWSRLTGRDAYNTLTPREAIRRRVERAAELVRKELPSDNPNYISVFYDNDFRTGIFGNPALGEIAMRSESQWALLREVIGDEELKELIQK